MSQRSVSVAVRADVSQFQSAMRSAAAATKQVQSAAASTGMGKLVDVARDNEQAWGTVSKGLMTVGTVGVAGLGAVTKAAMDWESSWAGVTKTVEGTPRQLDAVETGLRGLAKTLPASHQEIAAVAEAAGQLGIETPSIVGFTKTMIDLGETTNLSAEQAATSLARFMNVMGTSQSDVGRLGSTLVDLGNNFATTESEILAMSMRLAGTGNQIGLTEGEVMGLATAMSSVGIEAEAGGTAMSQTMTKINNAVDGGSDKLEGFAKVAGMSADDFAQKWKPSPADAMESFVQGLARVKESGGNVSATLDELVIKGLRERDTLLRLSGAAELLGDAFDTGNAAFEKNSALAAEAAQRYETTESQVKMAWNGIKDAAIDAGTVMLPVVKTIATAAAGIASAFGDPPGPVQSGIVAIGGIAAVAALAVGAGMKLVSMGIAASAALKALGITSITTSSALSTVGKAAGIAALAFAGFELAKWAGSQGQPAIQTLEQIGTTIRNTSDGALDRDRAFSTLGDGAVGSGKEIKGLDDAMALVNADGFRNKMLKIGEAMGVENEVAHAKAAFEGIDATLSQMASSGSLDQAAESFRQFADAAEKNGQALETVANAQLPSYMAALQELGNSYDYPLEGAELMAAAAGDLPPKLVEAMGGAEGAAEAMSTLGDSAEDTAESLQDIISALQVLGEINMSVAETTGAFHEAQRGLAETLAETGVALSEQGNAFDVTTESGYKAQQAFDGMARSGWDMAEAMANSGASMSEVQGALQGTYDGLVNTGTQFGLTGEQADALARNVLGIPEDVSVESWMSDTAKTIAEATGQSVDAIPAEKWVDIAVSDQGSADAVRAQIDSLHGKQITAVVTDKGTVQLTQGQINAIYGKTTKVAVTDEGTVYQVQGKIDGVTDGDPTIIVDENGVTTVTLASRVCLMGRPRFTWVSVVQGAINGVQGKMVYIDVIKRYGSLGDHTSPMGKGMRKRAAGGRIPAAASGMRPFHHGARNGDRRRHLGRVCGRYAASARRRRGVDH